MGPRNGLLILDIWSAIRSQEVPPWLRGVTWPGSLRICHRCSCCRFCCCHHSSSSAHRQNVTPRRWDGKAADLACGACARVTPGSWATSTGIPRPPVSRGCCVQSPCTRDPPVPGRCSAWAGVLWPPRGAVEGGWGRRERGVTRFPSLQLTPSSSSNLSSEPSAARPSLGSWCGPGEYQSARHCCLCCPPGHYVKEPCSSPHTQSECVACDTGTYMEHANGLRSCLLCATCRKDQEMVRDCTPTRDRQCQCKPGEYYCDSEPCPEGCHPCIRCPEGKVVLQVCNATADTRCGPPGAGLKSRHQLLWATGSLFSVVAGALILLFARKPGDGGGQAARCCLRAGCISTGCPDRTESLVPESSGPFVSSPETRDADAPVPTMGACLLPEDSLDVASESLILPGPPESPAGVDGPRLEAEAGDEAGPHAGHHGLTLLHPPAALA